MTPPNPAAPYVVHTATLPDGAGEREGERETIAGLKADHAEATRIYKHYVESLRAELAKRDAELAKAKVIDTALRTESQRRMQTIDELKAELAKRDEAIGELRETVVIREKEADAVGAALSRANERNANLHFANGDLRAQLDRLSAIEGAAKDVIALRYMACMTLDTAIYKLWLATEGHPSPYPPVVVPTAALAQPAPDAASAGDERGMSERERRLFEACHLLRVEVDGKGITSVWHATKGVFDALAAYATPGPEPKEVGA